MYSNNYEHSDIRSWLNGYFYNCAFSLNDSFIKSVQVNNDGASSDDINNKYASNKTTDKVYLPSYSDYLNSSYGFASDFTTGSKTRECKTTEYARCKGAWYNEDSQFKYNGSYWTRTATSQYYYCAWNVNSSGYLSTYVVNGNSHCVRPSITIYIPN